MSKKRYYEENATDEERKRYDKYTADDEELVLVTGLAKMYLRHQMIYFMLFPGGIAIAAGFAWSYFTGNNPGIGMLIGLIIATILAWWRMWILDISTKYLLTTRRIVVKRGVLTVKIAGALYNKITHIEVEQGFVDRIFLNHGTVLVNTAGSNKDELVLQYIEAPIEFKNLLERLINREAQHNGQRAGPIIEVEGEIIEEK